MEWRNDDDTTFTVHVDPAPRGPLSVAEHLLFAVIALGIIACSAWLAIYDHGVRR